MRAGKRGNAVSAWRQQEERDHALAEEWRVQGMHIDPATMPLTKLANSAIDGVMRHMLGNISIIILLLLPLLAACA